MPSFLIKKGDTRPSLDAVLYQDGSVKDLTDATGVYLVLKEKGGDLVFKKAASFGLRESGIVSYEWAVGDTDTTGKYSAEFEVHFGSEILTFPTVGTIPVTVLEDAG